LPSHSKRHTHSATLGRATCDVVISETVITGIVAIVRRFAEPNP
jgi:hypothetical protein